MAIDLLSDRSLSTVKDTVAQNVQCKIQSGDSSIVSNVQETDDAVEITDSAKALSRATDTARAADGIDSSKVEKLKAAINDGTYTVDAESIASHIIDEEDELSSIFG